MSDKSKINLFDVIVNEKVNYRFLAIRASKCCLNYRFVLFIFAPIFTREDIYRGLIEVIIYFA